MKFLKLKGKRNRNSGYRGRDQSLVSEHIKKILNKLKFFDLTLRSIGLHNQQN